MLRRLRTPLATAGGLVAFGAIDRSLTPKLKPLTTTAASVGSVGSVALFQYEVRQGADPCAGCGPNSSPLLRAQICPFCNKVKALLDLHKLPYETTEVNPLTKKETKSWSGGYKKVPIALIEGEQVNDSSVIANAIMDRMGSSGVVDAKKLAEFRSPSALEWAKWSDEKLAVLLFPNITRSFGEAYQAFGYVQTVPHFSMLDKAANQLVGSFFMWMAQGKIKKKYNIEDERAAVVEGINHWVSAGVGKTPFAGGERPNFADVCVFGCLKAIDRTDAYAEIMAETQVAPWYERMRAAVEPGNSCTSRQ